MSNEIQVSNAQFPAVPQWMQAMRDAAARVVKPETFEKIIQAQVDKAEKGDEKAAKFILDYLGGAAAFKGATFVQETHHHYADGGMAAPARRTAAPTKPTKAKARLIPPAPAEVLGRRLAELLSTTPADETELMLELECTPEELKAAVDWLRRHVHVDRASHTDNGLEQAVYSVKQAAMPMLATLAGGAA